MFGQHEDRVVDALMYAIRGADAVFRYGQPDIVLVQLGLT
jgi:hypothetical protein